jgi:hypothetical protein
MGKLIWWLWHFVDYVYDLALGCVTPRKSGSKTEEPALSSKLLANQLYSNFVRRVPAGARWGTAPNLNLAAFGIPQMEPSEPTSVESIPEFDRSDLDDDSYSPTSPTHLDNIQHHRCHQPSTINHLQKFYVEFRSLKKRLELRALCKTC